MVIRAIEIDEAARLFRQGMSKAEVAKQMGLEKKKVGKLLARANAASAKTEKPMEEAGVLSRQAATIFTEQGEQHGND